MVLYRLPGRIPTEVPTKVEEEDGIFELMSWPTESKVEATTSLKSREIRVTCSGGILLHMRIISESLAVITTA